MALSSLPLILCLLCAGIQSTMAEEPSAQCNDNGNGQCDSTSESPSVCGLYLARSSIPNSGLGVFTGVPHDVGAIIAPPEIAHQLLVGFDDADPQLHASSEYHNSLVRQYVWSSFVSGGSFEASMVESLMPGGRITKRGGSLHSAGIQHSEWSWAQRANPHKPRTLCERSSKESNSIC